MVHVLLWTLQYMHMQSFTLSHVNAATVNHEGALRLYVMYIHCNYMMYTTTTSYDAHYVYITHMMYMIYDVHDMMYMMYIVHCNWARPV